MSKKNYLQNLSSSLVDDSNENIVEKKNEQIESIINNENTTAVEVIPEPSKEETTNVSTNISNKYKERNSTPTASTQIKKEQKKDLDPLIKYSASVKKTLQKNSDLEYSDTTNTKISNEANKALKIMSLSSGVAGYKLMSSLILEFYNKHQDEFKL